MASTIAGNICTELLATNSVLSVVALHGAGGVSMAFHGIINGIYCKFAEYVYVGYLNYLALIDSCTFPLWRRGARDSEGVVVFS